MRSQIPHLRDLHSDHQCSSTKNCVEKALKDKSTVTVTVDVHREMPRCPPGDRKQKTPGQMIQAASRFSTQVDDIAVNVEVVVWVQVNQNACCKMYL